jgi:predicted acylesterase/phospholipase RssA
MPGRERPSRHVDGGVTVPVPVSYAAALDVDVVYVLDVTGGSKATPPRLNAAEVFLRSFSISRYAHVPTPSAVARPGQEIVVLPAPDTEGRSMRDFSNTAAYIEQAYFAASEMLARQTVA